MTSLETKILGKLMVGYGYFWESAIMYTNESFEMSKDHGPCSLSLVQLIIIRSPSPACMKSLSESA